MEFGGKLMMLSKKRENKLPRPPSYVKLKAEDFDHHHRNNNDEGQVITPKGHVPVMVGKRGEGKMMMMKRFVVPTRFMKDPSIAGLLQLSAEEFGYDHQGVLQIPCDPQYFESILGKLSKKRL